MGQKTQFIADYLRDSLSITELCELYGISRKSGVGRLQDHSMVQEATAAATAPAISGDDFTT